MSMTTEAPVTTCPSWCIASHTENRFLHLQADVPFKDLYGKTLEVSAFCDSRSGRHGIYLGSYEISPEVARLIALELNDGADLAERAAKATTR